MKIDWHEIPYNVIGSLIFFLGTICLIREIVLFFINWPPDWNELLGIDPGHTVTEALLWYAIIVLYILLRPEIRRKTKNRMN